MKGLESSHVQGLNNTKQILVSSNFEGTLTNESSTTSSSFINKIDALEKIKVPKILNDNIGLC